MKRCAGTWPKGCLENRKNKKTANLHQACSGALASTRGFEPPTPRLGDGSTFQKPKKGKAFCVVLFNCHPLCHPLKVRKWVTFTIIHSFLQITAC